MRPAALHLLLLAACAAPPAFDPGQPRAVQELGRWDVHGAGGLVGRLTLLQIQGDGAPPAFYRVSNQHGQWLGFIDDQGRVYQRVPFADAEVFRGMHPMSDALRLLCGVQGAVRLSAEAAAGGAAEQAPGVFEPELISPFLARS